MIYLLAIEDNEKSMAARGMTLKAWLCVALAVTRKRCGIRPRGKLMGWGRGGNYLVVSAQTVSSDCFCACSMGLAKATTRTTRAESS